MAYPQSELVTIEDIRKAEEVLRRSGLVLQTPVLYNVTGMFDGLKEIQLHLKLDNMQNTGSFKIRGIVNQMENIQPGQGTTNHPLVSLSAGNYGKTFAFMCHRNGLEGLIVMPVTAPENRATVIQSYGVKVERYPTPELQANIDRHVRDNGAVFLHSIDDKHLISGYGSLGLELMQQVPDADVIVVCVGGGGLISGVATAIRGEGKKCRIYGVEPEGARTMYESFKQHKPVTMNTYSVAAGLAPPYAGALCYQHCRQYVDDILLVTDSELLATVRALYQRGLVVEASGAAALAAVLHGKVPVSPGESVVAVLTGGNITPGELQQYFEESNISSTSTKSKL